MPGGFTYWAVFEDCRLLASFGQDPGADREPLDMIDAELEHARLGAIMHRDEPWQLPVLERARARWSDGAERPALARRVAFALGGLVHAASDEMIEPLTAPAPAQTNGDADARRSEIRAYQDAHVFDQAYASGHEDAFDRFLTMDDKRDRRTGSEEFLTALVLRALQSSHTIEPDMTAIDTWQDLLFADMERMPGAIRRGVDAAVAPDPDKVERYVTGVGFYRPDDPAIQVARALRENQPVNQDDVREALGQGTNTSAYGRAVERGVERLAMAAASWREERDARVPVPAVSP